MNESLGHARTVLGIVGASLAVCFFAAPLASLSHVMKTKSTEVLPFPLILSSFVVSGQWWLYGIILDDNFVKIPNFLGWLLATFQLLLFVYYPSKRRSSLPTISSSDRVPLLMT
jgi:solute carrier family 50 protein (sugar transporter)